MTVLFFACLYLPILAVALFSFNDKKSLSSFCGFSTRWYDEFFDDAALDSLVASLEFTARRDDRVARARHDAGARPRARPVAQGRAIGAVTLLPLVTPEIVTGVAALLLFTGIGIKLSLTTVILAEITFSIAYVTVIVRGRLADVRRRGGGRARPGLHAVAGGAPGHPPDARARLLGAGLLVFALVFDDFVLAFFTTGVDPQPLPVRIYSSIRFGVSPAINAVGTLIMLASALLIMAPGAPAPVRPQRLRARPHLGRRPIADEPPSPTPATPPASPSGSRAHQALR